MKVLLTIAMFLSLQSTLSASDHTKVNLAGNNPIKTVYVQTKDISQDRIMLLTGQMTDQQVDPIIARIKELGRTPKKETFLVIDSPGGYVTAGERLIYTIEGAKINTGLKITCVITDKAYSMAAILAAYCDTTWIQPNGSMMFHEAAYGIQAPASVIRRYVAFTDKKLEIFERRLAVQLGISYADYLKLRNDELWLTSEDSAAYGFVDAIVNNFYHTVEPPKEDNLFSIFFHCILRITEIE